MTEEKKKNPFKDDFDGEYVGNVFGWKFSIVGAVAITGFVILYFYLSSLQKNNPPIQTETSISVDSIDTNEPDTLDLH